MFSFINIRRMTQRDMRLSLGSDYFLNMKNITKEDYGFILLPTMKRFEWTRPKQETDALIMHILQLCGQFKKGNFFI